MKTIARAVAVALMTAGAVAVPLTAEASATPLPGSVSAAPAFSALHRGDSARIHHPSHYRNNGDLRRYHGIDLRRYRGNDRDYWRWDRYRNRCDRHSGWDLGRYRGGLYGLYSYGWDCCRF
ncbi:hypothetical protein AB0N87_43205 [Streptomyces sp. NPDC093228]|uniref:hypothetical protein n=1 Tax=unclassified Streptomyces TaxID=2593676 RepID=UPI000E3951DF|nr:MULTISPECIES: hypothetical protein [unclassified Streptomyces]MDX3264305.1 hypothetical protein [Streptomyces sp. MI02-2A]REE57713.1 hypothetical protein BX257_0082 [Streptomyces sp. 3212.3]